MPSLGRSTSSPSIWQGDSSQHNSPESSTPPSRESSQLSKGKHKVQWIHAGESQDSHTRKASFELPSDESSEEKVQGSTPLLRRSVPYRRDTSTIALPQRGGPERPESPSLAPTVRPKPSILKKTVEIPDIEAEHSRDETVGRSKSPAQPNEEDGGDTIATAAGKAFSQRSARKRAERLERTVGSHSALISRFSSPVRAAIQVPVGSPPKTPPPSPPRDFQNPNLDLSGYPLEKLETRRTYGSNGDDSDEELDRDNDGKLANGKTMKRFRAAAKRLVRHHIGKSPRKRFRVQSEELACKSGQSTPIAERDPYDYVPRPKQYQEGLIGSLMKLYNEQGVGAALANIPMVDDAINRPAYERHGASRLLLDSGATTPATTPAPSQVGTPGSSGSSGPRTLATAKRPKWYENPKPSSTSSTASLVSLSSSLNEPYRLQQKPKHKSLSAQALNKVRGRHQGPKGEDAIRIRMHVADVMQRKAYLLKVCRALMSYGAPTHRLEEHMRMSSRLLEIDSQFLYMPGCMIISFGDAAWHTTDVRIIRCIQRVNLSKLYDAHAVYKEVIHHKIHLEEGIDRLDKVNNDRDIFHKWCLVPIYGLASACVGPFAFGARPIDLPIAFILGCLLGFMQLILAPRSDLYSNIFEISAAVLTSFLARAFGSINNGNTFCFSALAQSSIALILPGYTVLCGSLELQSKNIVAGSVRMVYAIIYSLFLGFGITVGTSLYGAMDHNATSDTTCKTSWPFWWEAIFVLPFTFCLIIINQGRWNKMPPMLILAMVGYFVNHYSSQYFASNIQIAQTLAALAIGVIANVYSRLGRGLAAAILLPAIFVQVPSSLAASGSLISGVISANQITNHTGGYSSGVTTVSNGTQASGMDTGVEVNHAVLNVGYSMIQIAIGITVGLFLSALVVYPFGKRRSGLFSF
ncbi:MAG: hypothetical protein Q9217_005343 [Psora testacea]